MKSLQESLFDNDLINKSITLSPDVIYDTIFQRVYCDKYLNDYLLNHGWLMNVNGTDIDITKVFTVKSTPYKKVKVKMSFQFSKDNHPMLPILTFTEMNDDFRYSVSDYRATSRWIKKEFEGRVKIISGTCKIDYFLCDSESIDQVCNIISLTFQALASTDIDQLIQKEIDKFEPEKQVPGIVLDQTIMKKVIKEIA